MNYFALILCRKRQYVSLSADLTRRGYPLLGDDCLHCLHTSAYWVFSLSHIVAFHSCTDRSSLSDCCFY